MRNRTLLITIITLVTCFLLSGCLGLSALSDEDLSTTTTIANSETIEQVSDVTEEKFVSIDYLSLYTDSSKADSIYADQLFSLIVSDKNLKTSSSFENLGYAVTEEDALFYTRASALIGDSTNEHKMLEYLGYDIDQEKLTEIKSYLNARNFIKGGNYTKAYQILDSLCYLDSKKLAEEMYAQGLVNFKIRDTGPAGGIIFYDKGYYSDGWRFLEAAPEDLSEEYEFGHYRTSLYSASYAVGTSTAIGAGKANTEKIVKELDEIGTVRTYAAKACADYTLNGYDDWFLPSKDELNLMYKNLFKSGVGSFANDHYWSSSEYLTSDAWVLNFYINSLYKIDKSYRYRVRPVRAF